MINAQHIEKAIEKTLKGESNLTDDILSIRGFSTPMIRKLINNICNISGKYLEVGLLCGATFCASFNKNCESYGIEDFSQNFQEDIPNYDAEEMQSNISKYMERAKAVSVRMESFLDIDKGTLPGDIDIYFYDGEHGIECQSVALPEFFDNMAQKFAFIVDDCEWPQVVDGTGVGFKFLRNKISIEKKWELRDPDEETRIWANGVNIYLISKK